MRDSLSTKHRIGREALVAGRWRTACTCGSEFRAVTPDGAYQQFLDHVELVHRIGPEPEEDE